ncbi:hypothetical protein [Methanoplanus endosymbiosus]|uniref:Uncharacterized protein n=1 Tax=Methanoplanus endosymbiosus TaxID=33865 RepID=A0A9E7PLQ7_9EURY|nr:hypothetical protein [Methanoplanus endosymbiosus]UUX92483.1 hypothetical protein L6E24_14305 [Methanoplanus endosymbiosus]
MSEITNRNFGRAGLNNDNGGGLSPKRGMAESIKRPAGGRRDYSGGENLHRHRERKEEFVDDFVREVIKDCKTPKEELIEVLRARGFLIDELDGEYYLSDNSCLRNPGAHCSNDDLDQVVLARFLTESGLGTLDIVFDDRRDGGTVKPGYGRYSRSFCPGPNDRAKYRLNIVHDPKFRHLTAAVNIFQGLEGSTIQYFSHSQKAKEEHFFGHEHGRKVPVCVMDGAIARLCKAVSACGITTEMACDGHFGQKDSAWIIFYTHQDLEWFKIINECVVQPLLHPKIIFDYGRRGQLSGDVNVYFSGQSPVPDYMEIQRIAAFLYEHRFRLRQVKRKFCEDHQRLAFFSFELDSSEKPGDIPEETINRLCERAGSLMRGGRSFQPEQKGSFSEGRSGTRRAFEERPDDGVVASQAACVRGRGGAGILPENPKFFFRRYNRILEDLVRIYSPSGREQELAEFIVRKYGRGRWVVSSDELCNLYIRPKGYGEGDKSLKRSVGLEGFKSGRSERFKSSAGPNGFKTSKGYQAYADCGSDDSDEVYADYGGHVDRYGNDSFEIVPAVAFGEIEAFCKGGRGDGKCENYGRNEVEVYRGCDIDEGCESYGCSRDLPLLNVHLDTFPHYYKGHEDEAGFIEKLSGYRISSEFSGSPGISGVYGSPRSSGSAVVSGLSGLNKIIPGFNAGFDDKAGVAMVLYLMKYTSLKFKAVFTVQEEQAVTYPAKYGRGGGGGIDYAILKKPEFFKNSACVLTIDRQGGRDIIASYGFDSKDSPRLKLCSDAFLEKFIDVSKKVYHPMAVAKGSIADAYNIRAAFPGLDVLNISAGYYNEHRESEWLDLNDVFGVMRVVVGFLKDESKSLSL